LRSFQAGSGSGGGSSPLPLLDYFAGTTPATGGPWVDSSPALVRANHQLTPAVSAGSVSFNLTSTNWVCSFGCNNTQASFYPGFHFGSYVVEISNTQIILYESYPTQAQVATLPTTVANYHRVKVAVQSGIILISVDDVPMIAWVVPGGKVTTGTLSLNLAASGSNATAYFDYFNLASQVSDFAPVQVSTFRAANGTLVQAYTPDYGPAWGPSSGTDLVIQSNAATPAAVTSSVIISNTASNYTILWKWNNTTGGLNLIAFGTVYLLVFESTSLTLYEGNQLSTPSVTVTIASGVHYGAIKVQSGTITVWVDGVPAIMWNIGGGQSGIGGVALSMDRIATASYITNFALLSHVNSTLLKSVASAAPTTIATHAALVASGLNNAGGTIGWPDGLHTAIATGSGSFTFLGSLGSATSGVAKIGFANLGTLTNPLGGTQGSVAVSGQKNTPAAYGYYGGEAFYVDPNNPTHWLCFAHVEIWPGGDGSKYWSQINLAWSTDSGATWADLGPIVQPLVAYNAGNANPFDILGGTFLVINGYFYTFFKDSAVLDATGAYEWLAVARAKVSDVLAAAALGNVTTWNKLQYGQWSSLGLGGGSDPVMPALITLPSSMWGMVAYHTGQGVYIFVQNTTFGHTIQTSSDGLNWSPRQLLTAMGAPGDPSSGLAWGSIAGDGTVNDPLYHLAMTGTQWTANIWKSSLLTFSAP
jgi:hypothetical protein